MNGERLGVMMKRGRLGGGGASLNNLRIETTGTEEEVMEQFELRWIWRLKRQV